MATNQTRKFNDLVLIPTDFSEVSGNAISHGVKLAKFLGYKVCIVHVINKETRAELKKKNLGPDYIDTRLKEYKKYYNRQYAVEINTLAVEGSIVPALADVAKGLKANVMVLGTHGKAGLQHILGSYALRIVAGSPVPVVVVQKKAFSHGYKNIVFPISNDLEPRQAVEWAKLMAGLFKAKFHIIISPEKETDRKTSLNIITKQITDVFTAEKIVYTIRTAEESGKFADQVISCGVLNHADLIMIMTRPNIEVAGFRFSAWDERIMFNDAQIPVMGINPVELGYQYYEWSMLA